MRWFSNGRVFRPWGLFCRPPPDVRRAETTLHRCPPQGDSEREIQAREKHLKSHVRLKSLKSDPSSEPGSSLAPGSPACLPRPPAAKRQIVEMNVYIYIYIYIYTYINFYDLSI